MKLEDRIQSNPIFILGCLPRSGSNFLQDLLSLHPDCIAHNTWEDYLLAHSDILVKYAESVYKNYSPERGQGFTGSSELLLHYIGKGLISFLEFQVTGGWLAEIFSSSTKVRFLHKTSSKRLVTKTPTVLNIQNMIKLFPDAFLLIIVRDGRAVTESCVRSFGLKYEFVMRIWADSARTILRYTHNHKNKKQKFLIVRYENLFRNTEKELKRIFEFLNLDTDVYDFKATLNLPVRGSCQLLDQGKSLHWNPVEKSSDFNPIERWHHWSRSIHERFNWIAGEYLSDFGYKRKVFNRNRLVWTLWNIVMDIIWRTRTLYKHLPIKIFSKQNK